MTNFDFLKKETDFNVFSDTAIAAEKAMSIDANTCVLTCRSAMEFAVKWMYSVDADLEKPYDDRLNSLINDESFRDIVNGDIWRRLDFIRKTGNRAAHSGTKLAEDQALLCLENLFYFMETITLRRSLTESFAYHMMSRQQFRRKRSNWLHWLKKTDSSENN